MRTPKKRLLILLQFVLAISLMGPIVGPVLAQSPGYLAGAPAGRQVSQAWQDDGLRLPDGSNEYSQAEVPIQFAESASDLAGLVPAGIDLQQANSSARMNSAGGAILFNNFGILLLVPAGAFAETVQMRLSQASGPQFEGLNQAFMVEATAVANEAFVQPTKSILLATSLGAAAIKHESFIGRYDAAARAWDVPALKLHGNGLVSISMAETGVWAAVGFGVSQTSRESEDSPSPWRYQWQVPAVSSFTGSATFEHAIELPAGRGGLTPNIDVSYGSGGLNGLIFNDGQDRGALGTGWNINHIEIRRTLIDVRQNGNNWVLHHGPAFSLVLDGQNFHLERSSSVGNTTTYIAVNGPSLKVQLVKANPAANAGLNAHGLYWLVSAGNGTIYRLGYLDEAETGQTVNQAVLLQVTGAQPAGYRNNYSPLRWHVDTITDIHGNQIQYDYNNWATAPESHGTLPNQLVTTTDNARVEEIRYNFTAQAPNGMTRLNSNHGSEIRFELTNDRRVDAIEIFHLEMNQPWRVIDFELGASFHDNHPCGQGHRGSHSYLVNSIRELGVGGSLALPATTFSYQSFAHTNNGNCYRYQHMTMIENGYGGRILFAYANDGRQSPGWAGPIPTYGRSFYVVTQQIYDGINPAPATFQFSPNTPCYDQLDGDIGDMAGGWNCPQREDVTGYTYGHGALVGFARMEQTVFDYDGRQLQHQMSQFHQDQRRVSRLIHSESRASDGFVSLERDITYLTDAADVTGDGLNDFDFTYLRSETTTRHNRSGQSTATTTTHSYNRQNNRQFGNETRVESVANIGGVSNRQQIVTRDYFPNQSTWVVNAVARERQYDDATLVSESRNIFDHGRWNYPPVRGLTTRIEQLVEPGRYVSQSIEYDNFENPYRVEDALNNVTLTSFDPIYHLYPLSVTNALGHVVSSGYCLVNILCGNGEPAGLLRYQTDANGTTAFYKYDTFGRLLFSYRNEAEFLANAPVEAHSYHIFVAGPSYSTSWRRTQSNALPWSTGGSWQREFVDGVGRLIQQQAPHTDWWSDGRSTGNRIVKDVVYDALGQPINRTAPYMQPAAGETNNPYLTPVQTVGQITTLYNSTGNPIRNVDLTGAVNTTIFGLNRVYNIDPNGNLRVAIMDDVGQLTGVAETLSAYSDSFNIRWLPGWNRSGNVTAAGGSARLIGNGGWNTSIGRAVAAGPDWGVHFSFRGTHSNQEAYFLNDSGNSGQSNFQRWALMVKNGQISLLETSGRSSKTTTLLPFEANKTYRVAMRGDAQSREYSVVIWRDDTPEISAEIVVDQSSWNGPNWQFLALNRTAASTLWLDDYSELDFSRTHYGYDTKGNLESVTDALGNNTFIEYDLLGRKIWMSDPDMGIWQYGYDDFGNLIWQLDNRGQKIDFVYDDLHRLTARLDKTTVLASYGYDAQLGGNEGIGRRTSMISMQAGIQNSAHFYYDEFGQLLTETRIINGHSYDFQHEYSTGGLPTALYYPGNAQTSPQGWRYGEKVITDYYWTTGSPRSLVGDGIYVDEATYNAAGQLTTLSLGNNIEQRFEFDSAFRLQAIETNAFSTEGAWLDYDYDAAGNITSIVDYKPPAGSKQTQHFGYDALHRLTSAYTSGSNAGSYNELYNYDVLGNLLQKGGAAQSYLGQQPHALTHIDGQQVAWYDANGNMRQRLDDGGTLWNQSWTIDNMLSRATTSELPGEDISFIYDADSQLVLRRDHRRNQDTVQLGKLFSHDLGSDLETRHYAFGGALVSMREASEVSFFLRDHLGSTTTTLWANGLVRVDRRYDAWGQLRWQTSGSVTPTGYQYTSQRWDDELGLYDYNARYYDPETCRFISADSIVPVPDSLQAFNRYSYVLNRPTVHSDPSGHWPKRPRQVSRSYHISFNGAESRILLDALNVAADNAAETANKQLDGWQAALATVLGGIGGAVGTIAATPAAPVTGGSGPVLGGAAGTIIGATFGWLLGTGAHYAKNLDSELISRDLSKISNYLDLHTIIDGDSAKFLTSGTTGSTFKVINEMDFTFRITKAGMLSTSYEYKLVIGFLLENGVEILEEFDIALDTFEVLKAQFEQIPQN